jgi:pimeloyl-ACP methyl ester carboxylesterase
MRPLFTASTTMSFRPRLRHALSLLLLFVSACATGGSKPDLVRLYASQADDPAQPPVILIHGLMGSTLVDPRTGKQVWPGSLGTLAVSNYADLRADGNDGLVPGDLVYGLGGVVDYYGELTRVLERVAHLRRAQPGQPVRGPEDRRRYYVFLYDWRHDNVEAARGLHALIEKIRADYADPSLRVDLIAHSNGGLVANYFLRYGAADVLDGDTFTPTGEGAAHVRRVLLLGTPNLGSATSVYRLQHGMRLGLRTVPVEVLSSFATPFETLPHPRAQVIVDADGTTVPLDLYDPATWRERHWSVYGPEVMDRVRSAATEPAEGEAAVKALQATFERHLVRAGRFQRALAVPFSDPEVEVALFGGDCELTLARAIYVRDPAGDRLAFTARDVLPPATGLQLTHETRVRLEQLLFEPGDGLVTRASQIGRDRPLGGHAAPPLFPLAQSFFLCEGHGQLTANAYFQNNLLNFLLGR